MLQSTIRPGLTAILFSAVITLTLYARTPAGVETAGKTGSHELVVTSPVEGERYSKPSILVTGTTTPGADVTISGVSVTVSPAGGFSTLIPIPDEETTLDLLIKSTYRGEIRTVTRKVHYVPAVRLSITEPAMQRLFTSTRIPIQGEVFPVGATVTVMGVKVPVSSTGRFSGSVPITPVEGPVNLDFKATYAGAVCNETRSIIYRKSSDQFTPALQPVAFPTVSKQKSVVFTVVDRTAGDEITFHREIDGSAESETGVPGGRFTLSLEDGIHDYAVWATDKSGNRTPRITGSVTYMSSVAWSIRVTKPAGNSEIIRVPLSVPAEDFSPVYTTRFTVLNLPDDDPRLLKEVVVTNNADGSSQSEHAIADLDFEFEFALMRGKPNVFTVIIRDVNDVEKTASFSVELR